MAKMCDGCSSGRVSSVPFAVHESDMSRLERSNKRLWAVTLVLIVSLIISNLAWIIYESQYQEMEIERYNIEQEASGDGVNNSIIGGGNINGETED